MDKVHLEGEHTKPKENRKKGDIVVKKIYAINVARKGTLLGIANLLKCKVMESLSQTMTMRKNVTSKQLL